MMREYRNNVHGDASSGKTDVKQNIIPSNRMSFKNNSLQTLLATVTLGCIIIGNLMMYMLDFMTGVILLVFGIAFAICTMLVPDGTAVRFKISKRTQ